MKKLIICLSFLILVTLLVTNNNLHAESYVYDNWKNVIPSTEGITYKETYYAQDIVSEADPTVSIEKFTNLTDMEVFNSKIFLLDANIDNTTVNIQGTDYSIPNISKVYIINQNFRYEKYANEFVLTDYAKAKLDEFYRFKTPLEEITYDQYTSTEFVNIYEGTKANATVSASKATFDLDYVPSAKTDFEIVYNGKLVDPTTYTLENTGGTTTATFTTLREGSEVMGVLKNLKTPGRAPYLPYSLDPTKAAVRLSDAQGITANGEYIYIADSGNARVLKLNYDFEVVDVYLTPNDNTFYQMYNSTYDTEFGVGYEVIKELSNMCTKLSSANIFRPEKVAITKSGVLYVISANTYEGLVEFSADTTFNRFLGKNTAKANALKILLSNFFTEEQLKSFALSLPPMFNNLAVSDDGYLYATSNPEANISSANSVSNGLNMVKIINTKGLDIMNRNGYVKPDGDAVYLQTSTENNVIIGSSVLTAVAVSKRSNFTVCDKQRGRLFTYDLDGNLLYITGEQPGGISTSGSSNGLSNSIANPVALDYLYRTYTTSTGEEIEEETVICLDNASRSIILFETTEFGEAVNTATFLYQNGVITDTYEVDSSGNVVLDAEGKPVVKEMGAESYWRQVIKMNTNYELAYLGIGKALHRRDQYKEAMYYFKLAHAPKYYSKSFEKYRDGVLNQNFNLIMTVVVVFIVGIVVSIITKTIRKRYNKNAVKGGDE